MEKRKGLWIAGLVTALVACSLELIQRHDRRVYQVSIEKDEEASEYSEETLAKYPGGLKAFYRHMATTVNIPEGRKIPDKVLLFMDIRADGKPDQLKVVSTEDKKLADEIVRAALAGGDWIPGEIGRQKVKCRIVLSIVLNYKSMAHDK
ncbi:hypothetical protein FUAX_40000 (plasmid) [Fulvitalea axinellae]|uniref:TonB C-terminal domain-containing protein n=1 Tax=Fulvitalea axinellae TaxID=1182444 RepID=A0AAU9CU22_9BACT|nr:hypothetical protein FUAX_40000 [Fulvitalea axinellae]